MYSKLFIIKHNTPQENLSKMENQVWLPVERRKGGEREGLRISLCLFMHMHLQLTEHILFLTKYFSKTNTLDCIHKLTVFQWKYWLALANCFSLKIPSLP